MKAISIKQPWASLIVEGIKDIENRTWKLPEKYKGQRVLIHASAAKRGNNSIIDLLSRAQMKTFVRKFEDHGRDFLEPRGLIIGSVEIVDCVVNHPSVWAEKSEIISKPNKDDYYIGGNWVEYDMVKYRQDCNKWRENRLIYNWILANPIKFDTPIPAKGKLGFWDFESNDELMECAIDSGMTYQSCGEKSLGVGI